MNQQQFESLLRLWGRMYGEPRSPEWDEEDAGSSGMANPLQNAMDNAPRSCAAVIRQRTTMDRGGHTRRRLMARAAGVERMRIVPAAMVDHVRCKETRSGGGGMWTPPAEVELVQLAWKGLFKFDEIQASVVRVEYQMRGMSQREKAAHLGLGFGNYRRNLDMGRSFILGKVAA